MRIQNNFPGKNSENILSEKGIWRGEERKINSEKYGGGGKEIKHSPLLL